MAYFKRNGLVLSGVSEKDGVKTENVKHISPTPNVKLNTQPLNVKDLTPVTVKQESVKYAVQNTVKDEPQSFKKETVKSDAITIDNKTLDIIINRLTIAIERKIVEAIEKIKQELNVKYESLIVKPHFMEAESDTVKQMCNPVSFSGAIIPTTESEPKTNYCNPCKWLNVKQTSVKENTVNANNKNQQTHFTLAEINEILTEDTLSADNKNQEEHFTLTEIKETVSENTISENKEPKIETPHQIQSLELTDDEYIEQELSEIENEDEQEEKVQEEVQEEKNNAPNAETIPIQELEKQIHTTLQSEIKNKNSLLIEEEEELEEQEYKWVESELLKNIEKNCQNNNAHLFKNTLRNWSLDHTKNVNWISVRLRSLTESMIKLSNYNRIDKHTLLCITDAFNRLIKSNAFKNLPDNYPFSELIKELCVKLNRLVQSNSYSEQIRFTLSPELKSRLISTRYEMQNYFPAMKFSELDFTEEKSPLEIFKSDNNEEEEPKTERKIKDWQYRYRAMKKEKELNKAA